MRIPTSFCGMQGMKPTFGRVNASNTSLDTSTVTSIGVIANNVADVALVSFFFSFETFNIDQIAI